MATLVQRFTIELLTKRNLYEESAVSELLGGFLADLSQVTNWAVSGGPIQDGTGWIALMDKGYIAIQTVFPQDTVVIDIASDRSLIVSELLDIVNFWFDPYKIEIS